MDQVLHATKQAILDSALVLVLSAGEASRKHRR